MLLGGVYVNSVQNYRPQAEFWTGMTPKAAQFFFKTRP